MVKTYPGPDGRRWKKSDFEHQFEGSKALFDACWRKFQVYINQVAGSEINWDTDFDIPQLLDDFAAELVNDEKSDFWMRG